MRSLVIPAIAMGLVAASACASPTPEAERVAHLTAELASNTSAYSAVIQESLTVMDYDISGAIKARSINAGGDAAAKTWASDWVAQLTDKEAALKAHLAAAPPTRALLDELVRLDPTAASRAQHLATVPESTSRLVDDVLALSDTMKDDIGPAVAGDAAAQKKLNVDLFKGLRGELVGEVSLLEGERAGNAEHHPQHALVDSMIASNEAAIGLYEGVISTLEGGSVDLQALALQTHQKCAAARAAAELVGPDAVAMRPLLDAHGQLPRDTQARWFKAWDTFAQSGDVEVQVAAECDKMATGLDQGLSIPQAMSSATQLKSLVDQRMSLASTRQQDLAQGR